MRILTTIALVLLIVGGLNWLSIGLAQFDVVAALFGGQTAALSRIVYSLVGISAIIAILALPALLSDHRDREMVAPTRVPPRTTKPDGVPPNRP